MKTIIAYGELLWDILPTDTIIGGAPFNFAFRVNELGDRGLIMSRLGDDELGRKAFDTVVSLGLETTHLQWDYDHPTGTVQVSFDEENNPDYVIIPDVAYDYMETTNSLLYSAPEADCICFGTLSQRSKKSRKTLEQILDRSSGSLRLLDINLRKKCYSKETITFSLRKADVLKLNEDEACRLSGILEMSHRDLPGFCEEILNTRSLRYCLVTLAEMGAYALSDKGEAVYVPGYEVETVDSLGSGDAFSAGFIHKILHGGTLNQACELGNMLGALVAAKKGATAPITQEEITRLKNSKVERAIHAELEKYSYPINS